MRNIFHFIEQRKIFQNTSLICNNCSIFICSILKILSHSQQHQFGFVSPDTFSIGKYSLQTHFECLKCYIFIASWYLCSSSIKFIPLYFVFITSGTNNVTVYWNIIVINRQSIDFDGVVKSVQHFYNKRNVIILMMFDYCNHLAVIE